MIKDFYFPAPSRPGHLKSEIQTKKKFYDFFFVWLILVKKFPVKPLNQTLQPLRTRGLRLVHRLAKTAKIRNALVPTKPVVIERTSK